MNKTYRSKIKPEDSKRCLEERRFCAPQAHGRTLPTSDEVQDVLHPAAHHRHSEDHLKGLGPEGQKTMDPELELALSQSLGKKRDCHLAGGL